MYGIRSQLNNEALSDSAGPWESLTRFVLGVMHVAGVMIHRCC